MSDILIGVIVFGLVFGAAIFGMFLGRNLRVLEQKVNASDPPSPRLRRAKQTGRSGQVRRGQASPRINVARDLGV